MKGIRPAKASEGIAVGYRGGRQGEDMAAGQHAPRTTPRLDEEATPPTCRPIPRVGETQVEAKIGIPSGVVRFIIGRGGRASHHEHATEDVVSHADPKGAQDAPRYSTASYHPHCIGQGN